MGPLISAPRIIVGTSHLGSVFPRFGIKERADAFERMDQILELGCFAIDTATSYQLGGTERFLGRWIASRRNRDSLYLIGKGGHPYSFLKPNRVSSSCLSTDLHLSLSRLGTDHLDLYLLHRDHPNTPLESILETMTSFQREGKIRAWGVSNWSVDRIKALDTLARSRGVSTLTASSPHFSLALFTAQRNGCVSIAGDRHAIDFYKSSQTPVLAWSALGQGFFSPKVNPSALRLYQSTENSARRERALILAKKYGVNGSQIALAYLFDHPFPVFAVVAASTIDRMKSNLEASRLHLSAGERQWLETGEEIIT